MTKPRQGPATPPEPETPEPDPAAEGEDQDQAEQAGEEHAPFALYPKRLVRHVYTAAGVEQTRYGLVVDPDGPLIAWLPVEHVGHLKDQLEEV